MFEVRITRKEFPVTECFEKCIFFREGDGIKVKFHLQGIVYDDITSATVRNRLKKYDLKGNQDYKVSLVRDEDKYLAYICKDKDLVINTTDIDIHDYYDKYVKTSDAKTKLQKIFQDCDSLHAATLVSHAVDYYVNNQLSINPRLIQGYVLTHLSTHDREFRELLCERICDNLLK